MAQGLAPSSRRVYSVAQRAYFTFCSLYKLPVLPASEFSLMLFVTWLSQDKGLAPSFISTYLASIRSLHVDFGLPDPTNGALRLRRILRAARPIPGSTPRPLRLPITVPLLAIIAQALDSPTFDNVMFWAACCTAFFGFLRVSEFTCYGPYDPIMHLSRSDLSLDPAGFYRLYLKRSKTDPFALGCTIILGPSGRRICPVIALSRYITLRGTSPGPLFILANGLPLSPSVVNTWLRSILSATGIPGYYSSHSFRIGAATSAARAGVPDHLVKALGRWTSDAYLRYIRVPPQQLLYIPPLLM